MNTLMNSSFVSYSLAFFLYNYMLDDIYLPPLGWLTSITRLIVIFTAVWMVPGTFESGLLPCRSVCELRHGRDRRWPSQLLYSCALLNLRWPDKLVWYTGLEVELM